MTYIEFLRRLHAYKYHNPEQRLGQAAFNLMLELCPDQANKYRATKLDPFYNNDVIGLFIKNCLEPDQKEAK